MLSAVLVGLAVAVAVWLIFVAILAVAGRRTQAATLARLVPDCLVLLTRIVRDPRLGRSNRIAIGLVLGYLVLPIDLIPDVIPVAGQLDDAIVVALLLRRLRRTVPPDVLRDHWPGPPELLDRLLGATGPAPSAAGSEDPVQVVGGQDPDQHRDRGDRERDRAPTPDQRRPPPDDRGEVAHVVASQTDAAAPASTQ